MKNLIILIIIISFMTVLITNTYAETSKTEDIIKDSMKKQEKVYDAHRQYVKIHFDDYEMDFALQWVLGSTPNGGCEIGEAFYTVSQIKDKDPKSWEDEWEKMAKSIEEKAEKSLKAGHKVSARNAFLRASNYYRTPLMSMSPKKAKFKELGLKCRSCFKKACKLFNPPIEYIEIPFENTKLPGYFRKVDNSGKKRKTLIMIGGGETFAEDLYFYIGPEANKRGYNFITFDIPGQGLLPYEEHPFRADAEVPIKKIVDYTINRPEVDPKYIAMYGISGGGYFVPRASIHDKRIKAIAVNSAVIDDYKIFASMPFATATQEEINNWTPFKRCSTEVVAWRWGLEPSNIKGLVKANEGYYFDPSQVTCPALALIGEGEYANKEIKRQQQEFIKNVKNQKKKFVLTKESEGASSHCLGENRSLMSQIVFDWFDEVFNK